MIRLDTTTKTIEIVMTEAPVTTNPAFVTSYDDIRILPTKSFVPVSFDGVLNGTNIVTIIGAPSSGYFRNIKYVNISNIDSISHTLSVNLNNNGSSRRLIKVVLDPDESLIFNEDSGWAVLTSSGQHKVTGALSANARVGIVGISVNNGTQNITTGNKGYITIPYSGVIQDWTIVGNSSGSVVVDIYKNTYANYPPTIADSICGSNKPTLVTQNKNKGITTGWVTTVTAGDIFAFNVDSTSNLTAFTITIKILKN